MTGRFLRKTLVLGAVGLLGGCTLPFGGSSSSSNSSGGSSSQSQSKGPGVAGTVTENKEFWYGGFHVTLADATYKPPSSPKPGGSTTEGQLSIPAKFENLGTDTDSYHFRMSVASNGNSYVTQGRDEKLPTVPGKSTTNGTLAFVADEKFNLDDAVLTVGDADKNQAVIPLGSKGTLTSLAPRTLLISGAVNQPGDYTMNFTGGALSYDDPANHTEEDNGTELLALNFSVTSASDLASLFHSDASLKVPDGTAVASNDLRPGGSVGSKGTTKQGWSVQFMIKVPVEGSYDAIFTSNNITGQTADLSFSITASGGASASPGSTGGSTGATPSGH